MISQWFIWRKKKKSLKFDISFTGNKLIKAWVSWGLQVSTCGWVLAPVTQLDSAPNGDVGPPSSHSPSKVSSVRAQCNMAWPQQLNPWNITMLGGRNLSRRLSISGWRWSGSSSHTVWALEPNSLKKRWDSLLLWSCLQCEAVSWYGLAAQFSHHMLELSPVNERSPPCAFWSGTGLLLLLHLKGRYSSADYMAFLETLGGVLEGAQTGDSIILLTVRLWHSRGQQQC